MKTSPARRASAQAAKDRAYARGDCIQCFKPHKNVRYDRATGQKVPTRICARCQSKRTAAQQTYRDNKRRQRLSA